MLKVLSDRLVECRKEAGLTQAQLAIYADITEKAYQNYEALRREPRLEILVRIADALGVSLDYLTGRTDSRHGTVVSDRRFTGG